MKMRCMRGCELEGCSLPRVLTFRCSAVLGCMTLRRSVSSAFKISCKGAHLSALCRFTQQSSPLNAPGFYISVVVRAKETIASSVSHKEAHPLLATPEDECLGLRLLGWVGEVGNMCALLPLQFNERYLMILVSPLRSFVSLLRHMLHATKKKRDLLLALPSKRRLQCGSTIKGSNYDMSFQSIFL